MENSPEANSSKRDQTPWSFVKAAIIMFQILEKTLSHNHYR